LGTIAAEPADAQHVERRCDMTPRQCGPGALAGADEAKSNTTGRGCKPNSSREQEAAQAFACGCSPLPGQQMTLRSWRPLVRGSLRGFAAVTLPIGIEVDEIAVHVSGSRTWASLPGRPMIDGESRVLRDDRGKIRYASPMRSQTHGVAAEFGRRVIELGRRTHPAALDGAGSCPAHVFW
jgi:hypothetical protein